MPEPHPSTLRLGPRWLGAVLAAVAVILAIRNLPWHLDDYDQAKQAYVSFEMVKEGHWWLQHTPAGRIATKPPLVGWLSAGIGKLSSDALWPFAWRLPGMLAAAWLLWLLGRKGWRIGGWEGATLAVAGFGLNLVAPRLATLVRTDMVLALFIALAGFAIYEKLRAGTAWTESDRWKMFAILLCSMLTKGPIVYAFLLPGVAAFTWLQRGRVQAAPAWSGAWSWFGPLLFFGLWGGIGIATSPEFYDQVVRREFLGRFTVGEEAVHHNQPFWFYLLHLLRDFFPWSLALIALAAVPDVRQKLRRDPALLWLVCWAVGGLICMSLVPSKRGDRIFPVYPPLCLLLPAMLALLPTHGLPKLSPARRALALLIPAFLASGGYATYRFIESLRDHDEALTAFGTQVRRVAAPGRLAAVAGKDEGMLLYLDLLHFTKWDDARELWRARSIDAVVLPSKLEKEAAEAFPGASVAATSLPAREKFSRYICLLRSPE